MTQNINNNNQQDNNMSNKPQFDDLEVFAKTVKKIGITIAIMWMSWIVCAFIIFAAVVWVIAHFVHKFW